MFVSEWTHDLFSWLLAVLKRISGVGSEIVLVLRGGQHGGLAPPQRHDFLSQFNAELLLLLELRLKLLN